ncbi:SDR family NAD(P)-dependent oxidoreductase [Micromonospora arida]|uniref:SDR family NAD(P)-dependent oxidoreductase n=1 Tax=Micromonospora arida TaxID=2203715 RepID=UPI0033B8847E
MTRTWLITGGSQGLGKALVLAALEAGDRVVATSRKPEALASLVAEHPERLAAVALDVTSPAQAREVVAAAVQRFGSIDLVVNNAGYATSGSIEDFPEEEFRAQVEANLYGVVNVTRAVLPVMRGQRSGHIVQISSIGGRVGGTPGLGAYQTAKFAVEVLRGPRQRSGPVGHQGHHRRAGWYPHRLGHRGRRALRSHHA